MAAYGKSVQLFLVDGTPGGLMIAEIVNWTGKVLSCPRSNLDSLLKREEVLGTGLYILLGDDPENPVQPFAYIGETDEIRKRLIQHNADSTKDWWNRVIAITNKDLNLTKSHVRYLENRMIVRSREAKRSTLKNGNEAVPSPLPEAALSDMQQFLDQIELILPLLNVNILRKPPTVTDTSSKTGGNETEKPVPTPTLFRFHNPSRGLNATAQESEGEFVVLQGSEAAEGYSQPTRNYYRLKIELEKDGTLVPSGREGVLVFATDFSFNSPSAAGAVVAGRSSNGRLEWRVVETGQTYDAYQKSKIEADSLYQR